MGDPLDQKDLIHLPFLKEAQQFLGDFASPLDTFLPTSLGERVVTRAYARVAMAVRKGRSDQGRTLSRATTDALGIRIEIASFVLARIIVSCVKDRSLIERLCRYEAQLAYEALVEGSEKTRDLVAERIGFVPIKGSVPVVMYIEAVAGLREDRWRLVNREVEGGLVALTKIEADELMRERIRVMLTQQLPLIVPDTVCRYLEPITTDLLAMVKASILEEFGEIEEGFFPPCIKAIIDALAVGTNITHPGRFALTAFCHTIGMATTGIIELFSRAPDFSYDRTIYQVEHITGRGGTEYSPPSCATMRTHGLCVKPDPLCTKVNFPIRYYSVKKKSHLPREGGETSQGSPST
jgi:DNA primase large subunit